MPSLRETQRAFAAALRAGRAPAAALLMDGRVSAEQALRFYRHNGAAIFAGALERSFPVVRRRVGAACFAQLARHYRRLHPSRSGDLHWVGRDFPAFLARRLRATPYVWLADLARLEWACEEALVAGELPPRDVRVLEGVAPEGLAAARIELQASTRCVASDFPLLTVWRFNQSDGAEPVDLAAGGECIVLRGGGAGLRLYGRERDEHDFVSALQSGAQLGAAVQSSGLPAAKLAQTLGWLFSAGFVTAVT